MPKLTYATHSSRFRLSAGAVTVVAAIMTMMPVTASAAEPAKPDMKSMPAGPMDHSNMGGMKMGGMRMGGMSMTGDSDYDFAANMRMHHQRALEMSEAQIKNGKNPQMIKLAQDILAAHKKELAVIDQWMATYKKP